MILAQKAETNLHDIATSAKQQFHVHQGADQLVLFHKNTFEPDGVKIQEEFSGTSKQDSCGLKHLFSRVKVQETAEAGEQHVQSRLCAPKHHDGEEARRCKATVGPPGELQIKTMQTSLRTTSTHRLAMKVERRQ